MKRSEVLNLIAGLRDLGREYDNLTWADNLLCHLETMGMLPPKLHYNSEICINWLKRFGKSEGTIILNEWEPENE